MNQPQPTLPENPEDEGDDPLAGPIGLLAAGGLLTALPYLSDSRWRWFGIPTEYIAYFCLGVGAVWLPFELRAKIKSQKQ